MKVKTRFAKAVSLLLVVALVMTSGGTVFRRDRRCRSAGRNDSSRNHSAAFGGTGRAGTSGQPDCSP